MCFEGIVLFCGRARCVKGCGQGRGDEQICSAESGEVCLSSLFTYLPEHVCVSPSLSLPPLSLCRRRDCHQSHCVPARIPTPPSAYPPPHLSVFSHQHTATAGEVTWCNPATSPLSPSLPLVPFWFLPLHDIPITHMDAERIRLKPRGSTKVECEQCENRGNKNTKQKKKKSTVAQ